MKRTALFPPLLVPQSAFAHLEDEVALGNAFSQALRLCFRQSWLNPEPKPGTAFQPGEAYIAWDPAGVCLGVHVVVKDLDIHTTAVPDIENQHLWLLGDAIEFFIGREGSPVYHEYHLAPGGQRLRLRFPSGKRFREAARDPLNPGRHEPFKIGALEGERFLVNARLTPTTWSAFFQIPLRALAPRLKPADYPGSRWRVNIARYDYTRGAESPVHSATAPLTRLSFHRRKDWTRISLG